MSLGQQVVLYWTSETVAQLLMVPLARENFVRRTAGEMPVRMTKTGQAAKAAPEPGSATQLLRDHSEEGRSWSANHEEEGPHALLEPSPTPSGWDNGFLGTGGRKKASC